jgi:kynurenine formamidase
MCNFHPRQLKTSKSPWGPEDQIGRLNLITPESRQKVMQVSDFTRMYDLSVDYFIGMPSWTAAGDPSYQIWMTHTPSGNIVENPMNMTRENNELVGYSGDAFSMYTHTGTHIDALNHYGYHGEIWNGFNEKDHLGSRHWEVCGTEKFPPIIARGVLIDVAGYKGVDVLPDSYGIGKNDIIETLESQNVSIEKGDVVMIRTGRMTVWPDRDKYLNNSPGINVEAAEYLAEQGAMVIGADNIALEQLPSAELPGNWQPVHIYLFCEVGIPIIEVLWLEELAKDKIYEVGFVATNMPLKGATGAPLRPIAYPLLK